MYNSETCSREYFKRWNNSVTYNTIAESNLKPLNLKDGKLFSNVGVEPTFYPKINIPKPYDINRTWVEIFENYIQAFIENYAKRKYHKWLSTAHSDCEVLEIPSSKTYASLKTLTEDYKKLLNYLEKYSFIPSSVIQRDSEGGCHVNFDLENKINKHNQNIVEIFCVNVINFLNNYPSLVWSCLAPEDNLSSNIYLRDFSESAIFNNITSKGYCVNVRNEETKYIELRFFMMPRTIKEFILHVKIGSHLLKYVWNETIKYKKVIWNNLKSVKTLKNYTFKRAEKELNTVLDLLKITKKEMIECNKFQMLKERFKLGKQYLT